MKKPERTRSERQERGAKRGAPPPASERILEGARRRLDEGEETELGGEIREQDAEDDRVIIPGAELPKP